MSSNQRRTKKLVRRLLKPSNSLSIEANSELEPVTNTDPQTTNRQNEVRPEVGSLLQISEDRWGEAFKKLSESQRRVLSALAPEDRLGALQAILEQVRIKRNECNRSRPTIRFNGRRIALGDLIDSFMKWVDKFKQIGDVISSFDPVHAALPWAAMRFLIQAVTLSNEQSAALVAGLEKASGLISRCRIYEELYLQSHSTELELHREPFKNLEVSLICLYAHLLTFFAEACRLYDKQPISRRLSAVIRPRQVIDFCNECDKLAEKIDTNVTVCDSILNRAGYSQNALKYGELRGLMNGIKLPISQIETEIQQVGQTIEASRRYELLQWISEIPYERDHEIARENRIKGSGAWLINDPKYRHWRESNNSSILWLHGPPGTGKTKLASTVIDELKYSLEPESYAESLVFFYCDRNRSDHQSPHSITNSLIRQISASGNPDSLPQSVCNVYEKERKNGDASAGLRKEQSLKLITELTSSFDQVSIIIDALDECDPRRRGEIFKLVDSLLQTSAALVKVFISSRPDGDIKYQFRDVENIEIQASCNQQDIKLFVDEKLKRDVPWNWKVDSTLLEDIRRVIISKSNSMFLWASLQLDEIFQLSRETDIRERLGRLPDGLYAAYEEIYNRILSQKGSFPTIAKRAFMWLAYSKVPLSAKQLVAAVCQDSYLEHPLDIDLDIETVLESCHHLILYDRISNACKFFHLSVHEYLEQKHFGPRDSHISLAKVCLTLLIADTDAKHRDETRFLDTNCLSYAAALQMYAIGHWWWHVSECERLGHDQILIERLRSFIAASEVETGRPYQIWHSRLLDWRQRFEANDDSGYVPDPPLLSQHLAQRLKPSYQLSLPVCMLGLINLVPYLANLKTPTCRYNSHAESLIELAAGDNRIKMLEKLLNDPDFEWQAEDIDEAFCECVFEGNLEAAKILRNHGANVNAASSSFAFVFPLSIAARNGEEDMIRYLISEGADVNRVSAAFGNPLHAAALNGSEKIIQLLLESSIDINADGGILGSALQAACYMSHENSVRLLLANGADVNLLAGNKGNALGIASAYSTPNIVWLLLCNGADVDAIGKKGTAACAAVEYMRHEILQLLISYGANLSAKESPYGESAIELAFLFRRQTMISMMRDSWQALEVNKGLRMAIKYRSIEAAEYYLEHGANILDRDSFNRSVLHNSALDAKMFQTLRKNEKFKEFSKCLGTDKFGCTILHYVVRYGSEEILDWALGVLKIAIDQTDNQGWTALHWASYFGSPLSVRKLLEAGADPFLLTNDFLSPNSLALVSPSRETEVLLQSSKQPGFAWHVNIEARAYCNECLKVL